MGWWLVLKYLAALVVGFLASARPRAGSVQPGGLSDLGFPTADEGAVLPVVFGTCWLRNPTVLWYGNLTAAPIYENGQVAGHRYFITVQYGLCHGTLDPLGGGEVVEVRFDEWRQPDPQVTDHGTFWQLQFDAPTLFGGREVPGEGGFIGRVDVYKGGLAQAANGHLQSLLGPLPAYRGLAYAVFTYTEFGNSPTLRPVSFVVKRTPNTLGLAGGTHDIAGDANPAAVLYEILTDRRWGLGLSSGAVDAASFVAAGATLAGEGLGVSMTFDQSSSARDFLEEVLRHVDGVIYTDPQTGLLTLALARADYVFDNLPVLDESMVRECTMTRRAWADTVNAVRIRYNERTELTGGQVVERVATAQDLANIQMRGGELVTEEIGFRGLSNAANAQRQAARALKTLAYPLADFELECDRNAWSLRPGTPFRLQRPSIGIDDMVCRVARIRGGTLTDGRIAIEATEDIWGIAWTAYSPPPPSGWVPPTGTSPGWGSLWGGYWGGA